MHSKYTCTCGKSALYGEVHICSLYDNYYVLYLNQSMRPFFLTHEHRSWFMRVWDKLFGRKEEPLQYTTEQQDDIKRFNNGAPCPQCEMPVINRPEATMHYIGCGRARRIWKI